MPSCEGSLKYLVCRQHTSTEIAPVEAILSTACFWEALATIVKAETRSLMMDSFKEQASQGSFVPHGRQDVLTATIGHPEHPGCVHAAGAIADPANQGPARGVDHKKSDSAAHGIVQPDAVPVLVPGAISGTCTTSRASGWSLGSSRNDPETGDSERCCLYIEAHLARLVALGRLYEGSTIVHNTPLLPGQVKVGVEEVKDPDALVHVPTDEVSLVGQAIHAFLAWPTHLVKPLSQQAVVSPAKPPQQPDPEVDDLLYLMTLTIPELFLRPCQVTWDPTVFGVFNPDFPLYIKHEDLSEIAHGDQCLSILVLQLWILHLTKTSMRAGNSDLYGFLEPYWMQSSERDVYLGAYLNGHLHYNGHWQMVVIVPKEHLVVWFCSLHNRADNNLKGIINRLLLGELSSRYRNIQKGSTECSYYVMHWMSTIILGSFRNNWEAFNDPLELERLKALRIQWAQYYLRVRAQS
ncbi:hypothetical protein HKD37_14G040524 [Glycine soja]